MIVVCDISKTDKPVYWVWVTEAAKEVQSSNPNWQNQETVTLHIPTLNLLCEDSAEVIAHYVKEVNTLKAIHNKLAEIMGLNSSAISPSDLETYRHEPDKFLHKSIVPLLKTVGLLDSFETQSGQTITLISIEDREHLDRLKECAVALRDLRDRDTKTILDELSPQAGNFSDGVKAAYFNCRGVLCVHLQELAEAVTWYKQALALRPTESKYLCNLLFTQLLLSEQSATSEYSDLPRDWKANLDELLTRDPTFLPAIRLNAYHLARLNGPDAAEVYLRSSIAWEKDKLASIYCSADIYKSAGHFSRALSLLEEAEDQTAKMHGTHWELKAAIHLRLGLGKLGRNEECTIKGYGPSDLNFEELRKAFFFYKKSLADYSRRGYPMLCESAIVNFSTVAGILGKPQEAEIHCRQFLDHNPGSDSAQESLSGLLVHQDRAKEATVYLRDLYQRLPHSRSNYKNFATALLLAEDYLELLRILKDREANGFLDAEEEGFSRMLAAMALAETGEETEANKQLVQLERIPAERTSRAVIAKAEIIRRIYGDKERASAVFREGLSQYPNDGFLLTQYACHLGAPTPDTARELLEVLSRLSSQRQLFADEYYLLINAQLLMQREEDASNTLQEASQKYPESSKLILAKASVLWRLGREEEAYRAVSDFLKTHTSYTALREAAALARDTGRLDEAISLFERVVKQTTDFSEKAQIHAQLYLLKRMRKDAPKEILRHVIEFGKTSDESPEREAQFFMMFLMTPGEVDREDPEIVQWQNELRTRMQRFSTAYPKFSGFRAFKIDQTRSTNDQLFDIFTEIIAQILPQELAKSSFLISARSNIWPLTLRAKLFPASSSIFDLWNTCIESKEFSHGLHIWHNDNDLGKEILSLQSAHQICMDLTAILTLAHLDILQLVSQHFNLIIISKGTRQSLETHLYHGENPYPIVAKIEKWRLANLRKIRVRDGRASRQLSSAFTKTSGTSLIEPPDIRSIDELLDDGIGESVLLARKLGLVLYSDEASLRSIAAKEYSVPTASTISMLKHLADIHAISQIQYLSYLAELIKSNFRTIPFSHWHLNLLLQELLSSSKKAIRSEDLTAHPVMGVFLRQFGDTTIDEGFLYRVAVDWWVSAILNRDIPNDLLPELMEPISAKLALWRMYSGVIHNLENEEELRAAGLWAAFLWRCYIAEPVEGYNAWIAIKDCCHRIIHDPQRRHRILFEKLPEKLYKFLMQEPGISADRRLSLFAQIPLTFPGYDADRSLLEKQFMLLWTRMK
jgi:tetratricopeptide (TPR) repeat protein/predicted nucleic acid-binding protein